MNQENISIRKTIPLLYWSVTVYALIALALGLNFILLQPTFLIFGAPNELWGVIFLALGVSKIIALNFYRRLRLIRGLMSFKITYMMFLALGTSQPYIEGKGSLQLPIMYAGISALQIVLLLLPSVIKWSSKS